jgi:hypothetical protein
LFIKRSVALAILTVVNIIGTAVGFLLPPLFVESTSQVGSTKIMNEFTTLLAFEFIFALIPTSLILLFFK